MGGYLGRHLRLSGGSCCTVSDHKAALHPLPQGGGVHLNWPLFFIFLTFLCVSWVQSHTMYAICEAISNQNSFQHDIIIIIIIIIIIMEYTPARGVQDTKVITNRTYNNIKTLCTRNCINYIFIS